MMRRGWLAWLVIGLGMAALGVGLAFVIDRVHDTDVALAEARAESAARQEAIDVQQEAIDVLASDVRVLRDQVERSGGEPAAPPPEGIIDDLPVEVAPTTEQIRSAVTFVLLTQPELVGDQIVAVVTAHLTANPPADGSDGEPGRPPTAEEIAPLVAAYLIENPPAPGPAGQDGQDGADSTVAGPSGTDGKDGKDGADSTVAGPSGTDGTDGEDGRGIVSTTCNEDGTWTFTYDQEPFTDTVEGPCRVDGPPLLGP